MIARKTKKKKKSDYVVRETNDEKVKWYKSSAIGIFAEMIYTEGGWSMARTAHMQGAHRSFSSSSPNFETLMA